MTLLGIDIGATNLRVAAVTPQGRIAAGRRTPTHAARGPESAIRAALELADAVLADCAGLEPLAGVGVGITGPVDVATGIVDNPHTLTGWPPTDVASPFRERLGVPVVVENDANSAALGEWWCGAGRGARRLATITVGTGIGAGFLVDGAVQRRSDGRHGEAGHHVLDPGGPPCYCGARGCWEVLAAGPALARMARAGAPAAGTPLHDLSEGDPERIDGALVGRAARAGDPVAFRALTDAARWIGLGLVNTAAFFAPDTVVLAGGVSEVLPLVRPAIDDVLARHRHLVPTDMEVRAASTGDDAGVLGAAYAASGRLAPAPTDRYGQ
jgi:glucokinase